MDPEEVFGLGGFLECVLDSRLVKKLSRVLSPAEGVEVLVVLKPARKRLLRLLDLAMAFGGGGGLSSSRFVFEMTKCKD